MNRPVTGGNRLKLAAILGLIVVWLLLAATPVEAEPNPGEGPKIPSKAWALIDLRSGETLASHRPHDRLPMASTTKLMTAWIALHELPFNRRVKAVDYRGDPSESLMGLKSGEKVSVRDLLYGLIMLSGNDAAETLAVATSGSVSAFVTEMNRTARKMKLTDTHYENPIGLDGRRHFSSATDLATLGRQLMQIPRFRRIARSREATFRSLDPPRRVATSNSFLINNPWAQGIKTGHTLKSGYSLVSDGRKHATELIGAAIGAPTETARNTGSTRLLEYGFSLYRKRLPIRPRRPVAQVPVKYADGETLPLVANRKVRIGVRDDQQLLVKVEAPEEVQGPIRSGQRLGVARVTLDGERIASVPLRAAHRVEAPTWLDRIGGSTIVVVTVLFLTICGILGGTVYLRRRRTAKARRRLRRAVRRRS